MKSLPLVALAAFLVAAPGACRAADTFDSEILATVNVINRYEIDAANAALERRPSSSIKDFARMMLKDHSDNMNKVDGLGQKLNLSLSETPSVAAVKAKQGAKLLALKAQTGSPIEKAYMDAMVKDHGEALEKIENLLPRAQNIHVKRHLQDTRVTLGTHLNTAKQIQADLNQF